FLPRQSIKLVLGRAFRAPSLFELYFRTDEETVQGNPDLDPETADTAELTYLASIGPFVGQATAYYAVYDHIVFRDLVDDINVYANGPALHAAGAELEVAYRIVDSTDAFIAA